MEKSLLDMTIRELFPDGTIVVSVPKGTGDDIVYDLSKMNPAGFVYGANYGFRQGTVDAANGTAPKGPNGSVLEDSDPAMIAFRQEQQAAAEKKAEAIMAGTVRQHGGGSRLSEVEKQFRALVAAEAFRLAVVSTKTAGVEAVRRDVDKVLEGIVTKMGAKVTVENIDKVSKAFYAQARADVDARESILGGIDLD